MILDKNSQDTLVVMNPGSYNAIDGPIAANAEIEVKVYTRFDEDPLPHDWSFIVWADQEPVKIRHKDGRQSASFHHINYDPSIEIPSDFPPDSFGRSFDEITNFEKAWLKYYFDILG